MSDAMPDDACVTCGASINDTLSGQTAALYEHPNDVEIAAWACSDVCSDAWLDSHPVLVTPTAALTIDVAPDGSISDDDARALGAFLDGMV